MGNTRRVAERDETSTVRSLRPAVPAFDGPLASSGAAPESPAPAGDAAPAAPTSASVPAPRRAADADSPPTAESTVDPAPTATTGTTEQPTTAAEAAASTATGAPTSTGVAGPAGAKSTDTLIDLDVPTQATTPAGAPANRRIRVRFAHAVRRWPSPVDLVGSGARAVRAWSRRPSGRLTLPAVLLIALVAAGGAAGAVLVPTAAGKPRPANTGITSGPTQPGVDGATPSGVPASPPVNPPLGGPTTPPVWNADGRPADVLASWAGQIGARLNVSPVAIQAYGYAELALAQSNPGCQLRWTTLAAIGFVESSHGQANGATLGADGRATPEIIGPPLDGKGGRQRIMDTDNGTLDRDTTYDRAVGPMQFIPTTWAEVGVDADNDGRKDPHDLDDAALAAGNYLCKGGRNLSIASDWWNAILSYNDVRSYAQSVFDTANRYGIDSRT